MARVSAAILTTGDEIIQGDIIDSNAASISRFLLEHNIITNQHLSVGDSIVTIADAINYLLPQQELLIVTGGLGPTTDDCTRFALERALSLPLVFNEKCWQLLLDYFKLLNRPIPDCNRQQCLFPQDAIILPNKNGTAAGCLINTKQKTIIVLPGPPAECLPILKQQALPYILEHYRPQKSYRAKWLLLNIGESDIAEKVAKLDIAPQHIGYRICYPYLEVKLSCLNDQDFLKQQKLLLTVISDYIISDKNLTALQQLIESLAKNDQHIYITDNATQGALQYFLTHKKTQQLLHFNDCFKVNDFNMDIKGLDNLWDDKGTDKKFSITINYNNHRYYIEKTITASGTKALQLSIELICYELLKLIR